ARRHSAPETGVDRGTGVTDRLGRESGGRRTQRAFPRRVPGARAGRRGGGSCSPYWGERAAGIYHCTGAEDRTYVDLARILAESMDRSSTLVQATSCQSVNMAAAARPRHTTLEMAVERTRWGLTAPTFEATARRIIASLR
ncbi:MAG: sugar nucleotide-binding protein, partial [Alphaproteobacteria bacterium]|nr:sugar nucleotide-binding protein [Alphaproteobacteria bacterium]